MEPMDNALVKRMFKEEHVILVSQATLTSREQTPKDAVLVIVCWVTPSLLLNVTQLPPSVPVSRMQPD